jgi:hypothetical protein
MNNNVSLLSLNKSIYILKNMDEDFYSDFLNKFLIFHEELRNNSDNYILFNELRSALQIRDNFNIFFQLRLLNSDNKIKQAFDQLIQLIWCYNV